MSPPRVIVIGAGPAGLAASRRLAASGADVCLLERATRLGGRAAGGERDGFVLEPSAPVLSTGDRALRELLEETGLADRLLVLRSGGEGQLHAGWIHESLGEGWRAVARLPGVGLVGGLRTLRLKRLLARFGSHLDPLAPERAAPQDDRSLADFARLYFGSRVLERWAGPLVTADCLGSEDETSRVLFLRRYAARTGATPALFREGAGAFWKTLADGLAMRMGAEATRVECDGPGGALVHFREDSVEGTVGADAVVVATPSRVAEGLAGGLLAPAERAFFRGLAWEPAITLEVGLGDPIGPRYLRVRVPREEGSPLASLALEPGRSGGRAPDGAAIARLVARSDWSRRQLEAPDDAVRKELLQCLARVFPETAERVRFARVSRWREALPHFGVGHYRALARFARVQRDRAASGRRVYFAGDYLADPSIDGAVASGLRAADAAAIDLGL